MRIFKVNKAQRIVYGLAGTYTDADGRPTADLQGDVIEPDVIEKAAVDFMLHSRESGIMHKGKVCGKIVASLVLTPDIVKAFFGDKVKVPCSWLIGVKYFDKKIFKKIVNGELSGFSIQGEAEE